MKIGVIADDFTGATDIASFMVQGGLATVQVVGIPSGAEDKWAQLAEVQTADCVVVSLKSRSCRAQEAVNLSLAAQKWLDKLGAEYIYFKYCSTFDSTADGNIGPVLEALCQVMGESQTVLCPALPVNQRNVYKGYLFVGSCLLHESHMAHHPLNPMVSSKLENLLEPQLKHKNSCGLLEWETLQRGSEAVQARLQELEKMRYVICDSICDRDLEQLAAVLLPRMRLFSGGSGLGWALAQHLVRSQAVSKNKLEQNVVPSRTVSVVLSGSCSKATLEQIDEYKKLAPAFFVDVLTCAKNVQSYVAKVIDWFNRQSMSPYAPMLYASAESTKVQEIQSIIGKQKASKVVEDFFAALAINLKQMNVQNFIIAGGEISGAVVQALQIRYFAIGHTIAPGVPWLKSLDSGAFLALKSGNFGDKDFFRVAQETMKEICV